MAQTKIKLSKQAFADANFDFNAKLITNLATPVSASDAATKSYVDALLEVSDALVYKGVIDCSTGPNYPAANTGHVYKVSVGGKLGGAAGVTVYVGDTAICTADDTLTGDNATVGSLWNILHTSAEGNVISGATSVNTSVAVYDGTTGKLLKTSKATIDADGSIDIPTGETYKINGTQLYTSDIPASTDLNYCTDAQIDQIDATTGINTGDETVSRIGILTNSADAKTSIVDGDKFVFNDSEASGALKTGVWSLIKSTLKTFFMGNYICREAVTGTKNGVNVEFTVANSPVAGKEMVFYNGLLQMLGASNDYTISDSTITFSVAPLASDVILVTYWK